MSEVASERALIREEQQTGDERALFGFWTYIMTDCVLFASLFATFAVLRYNTFGGPGGAQLFSLPYALVETLILLTSSFTCGLALLSARRNDRASTFFLFGITFLLGIAFLGMEFSEFRHLVIEGNSWRRSGFLSSYFALVATHGLHITVGLIWMAVLLARAWQRGFNRHMVRRLMMLSLFWHFLDVIWIFIFSIVYLMGAL